MIKRLIIPILVIFFFGANTPSWGEYDYINISNPFLNKIPLAIPVFKPMTNSRAEAKVSDVASQLLSDTLAFTGFFKIIDRGAFLEEPSQKGIVSSKINFRNWRSIGSELLITGGVFEQGENIVLELRLFDTFKEKSIIARKYTGKKDQERQAIRLFCKAIIEKLTGNAGIFESKIAFVSNGSGTKELYMCDFDGYRPMRLTSKNKLTFSPSWSSDGEYLAYTSYARGKPDLFIKNLSGKRGSIVDFKGVNLTPTWVPGKFELAATLSFSGDQEIYLLTGTGKIIKRLTNQWGIDVEPTFSPDGKKMAYVSNKSGNPQIYIMDLATRRSNRLTFQGKYNTSPCWSPVDNKILYVGMEEGELNIYMIEDKGGIPIQLTQHAGANENPSWSPDGSLIVFSSTREGKSRIYVMTSFGTDQRRLLLLAGEQFSPNWSPSEIKN